MFSIVPRDGTHYPHPYQRLVLVFQTQAKRPNHIDLEALKRDKEKNFDERLEFIDRYVE